VRGEARRDGAPAAGEAGRNGCRAKRRGGSSRRGQGHAEADAGGEACSRCEQRRRETRTTEGRAGRGQGAPDDDGEKGEGGNGRRSQRSVGERQ